MLVLFEGGRTDHPKIAGGQQRLTIDDAKAVDERATTLVAVQPEMRSQQQIVWGNKNASTQITDTAMPNTTHRVCCRCSGFDT